MSNNTYFIKRGKKVFGPSSINQIKELSSKNQIKSDDFISTSKDGNWRKFSEISHKLDIKPELEEDKISTCPKCGEKLSGDSTSCLNCISPSDRISNKTKPQRMPSNRLIPLSIAITIALSLVVGLIWISYNSKSKVRKELFSDLHRVIVATKQSVDISHFENISTEIDLLRPAVQSDYEKEALGLCEKIRDIAACLAYIDTGQENSGQILLQWNNDLAESKSNFQKALNTGFLNDEVKREMQDRLDSFEANVTELARIIQDGWAMMPENSKYGESSKVFDMLIAQGLHLEASNLQESYSYFECRKWRSELSAKLDILVQGFGILINE